MTTATAEPNIFTPAPAAPAPAPAVPSGPTAADQREFAQRLRSQTIACRLRLEKLGTRKALGAEQRRRAAEPFGADHKALSASKKLLDTRDPAFRAVRAVLSRAKAHWKAMTTPYPEPGIRLIRKSSVELFNAFMQQCAKDLDEAVAALQAKYPELKERAAQQLAELFDEFDYPSRVDNAFGLEWDFPSVDPPAYLKQLNPELYEAECRKIEARFSVAVEQAEQAFVAQFQQIVAHLAERLRGDVDGKPKVFRDTAVENLNAFFEQFKSLDIGSSDTLQQLVEQAQQVVAGVTPDDLRGSTDLRDRVAGGLAAVQQELQQAMDGMMVARPKRKITLEDEE